MNFLEQLTAEWFTLQGYFVQTNLKYGKRARGGWTGEMDVIAFHPQNKELVHIETSMDALSWEKRRKRFSKKFSSANKYYRDLFKFPYKLKQIVVVGYGQIADKFPLGENIEVKSIPQFINEVSEEVKKRHPLKRAIPEHLTVLRAMQFALYWSQ